MTAPIPNYAHLATFEGAHDGDTFTLRVDFGKFSSGVCLAIPLTIRLYGFDAWELRHRRGRSCARTSKRSWPRCVVSGHAWGANPWR